MYEVWLYRKVRLACHRDGMSARHAALEFGINRRTVDKMLEHSFPPRDQVSVDQPNRLNTPSRWSQARSIEW